MIVRENTEDLYAGVEYDVHYGGGEADHRHGGRQNPRGRGHLHQADLASRGRAGSSRPRSNTRGSTAARKISAVAKANIMKYTDGLFFRVAAGSGEGVSGHRVPGSARRQHVHAARPEAGTVRRAGDGEPVRRHSLRPVRRSGRRPGRRAGREHRRRHARCSSRRTAPRPSTRARTRSIPSR